MRVAREIIQASIVAEMGSDSQSFRFGFGFLFFRLFLTAVYTFFSIIITATINTDSSMSIVVGF